MARTTGFIYSEKQEQQDSSTVRIKDKTWFLPHLFRLRSSFTFCPALPFSLAPGTGFSGPAATGPLSPMSPAEALPAATAAAPTAAAVAGTAAGPTPSLARSADAETMCARCWHWLPFGTGFTSILSTSTAGAAGRQKTGRTRQQQYWYTSKEDNFSQRSKA